MSENPQFTAYFSSVYGARWPALLQALKSPEQQWARPNAFASDHPAFAGKGEIPRAQNEVLAYYVMDPASIAAAKALEVQAGDRVLDMCAAPGGKTLILAEAKPQELIANELSAGRRERLKKVLQQYIPRAQRDSIFIHGKDAGKYALTHKEHFDKILLDAPCSGERHLLQNSIEFAAWTEGRTKKLAQRQYALLTAAAIACKPGGRIVYSTCSISPHENDGVIAEFMRRKPGVLEVENLALEAAAEKTQYGVHFLPDASSAGPIFICVLRKIL